MDFTDKEWNVCRNCVNLISSGYKWYDTHRCMELDIPINIDMNTTCKMFNDLFDYG